MQSLVTHFFRPIFNRFGYKLEPKRAIPSDFLPHEVALFEAVKPYTLTSPERIYALTHAIDYIIKHAIPGCFIECGVYRGGSVMAMAKTLLAQNEMRDIYLFDTFEGMPKPSDSDGKLANTKFEKLKLSDSSSNWTNASLQEVKEVVYGTGYPQAHFHFQQGLVEDTIPEQAPAEIALLRLDTDWYESTKHELIHLYPRLAIGGVLIIDDYGRWPGARRATDEYLAENNVKLLLHRVDSTCRVGIKL